MFKILLGLVFVSSLMATGERAPDLEMAAAGVGLSLSSRPVEADAEKLPSAPPAAAFAATATATAASGGAGVVEIENPYHVLFEGFERKGSAVDIVKTRDASTRLGMVSSAGQVPLYQSKKYLLDFCGVVHEGHADYCFESMELRKEKREAFVRDSSGVSDLKKREFIRLLAIDRAQDEGDKKKVLNHFRDIYFSIGSKSGGLKYMYENLIQQDITLKLRVVFDEYEARPKTEKCSVISGGLAKLGAGIVGVVSGTYMMSTSGISYCGGTESSFPMNATLAYVPTGPSAIRFVPDVVVNGTVTVAEHMSVSPLVDCGISSSAKFWTGAAAVTVGIITACNGISDLVFNPMAATDARSLLGCSRSFPTIDSLKDTIFKKVISVEDASMQEDLIASAISLVKVLLPRAAHVDVVDEVEKSLSLRKAKWLEEVV